MCALLISCASTKDSVGTESWYNKRMAEIEEAYKKKEIDEAKYLELKNETDSIRAEHTKGRSNTFGHIGVGSGGGSVGIGVGF